ncbi:MAG TPA: FAD-dependent oxidoreductase, partial [Acidobacteriota bacterium]
RRVDNFYDWVYETFGEGVAKYFMVPYNEKLWQSDLREISLDWVNWSIPKPSLEEVINGALGIKNRQFGYNPVFYYPVRGGIQLLPDSFPIDGELILGTPVVKVNLKKRIVTLKDGTTIQYKFLFSTMPLHALAGLLEDGPSFVRSAADKLRYVSVLNINLGIERAGVIPYHWVYFPETDIPFYRIGCPSNFSANVAPAGTSSLFVEVSLKPEESVNVQQWVDLSILALRKSGVLKADDKIVTCYPILLKYAYVVFNHERKRAVEKILRYLNARGVYSFGRYGSWIYSSMEDAVLQGKEFAEKMTTMTTV